MNYKFLVYHEDTLRYVYICKIRGNASHFFKNRKT